jgi:hypothetical protein
MTFFKGTAGLIDHPFLTRLVGSRSRLKTLETADCQQARLLLGLSASPSVPFVPVISATYSFAMPTKAPQGSHKHWQRE